MAGDMRGTDVVIIGALIYLIYQQYKSPLGGGGCLPSNIPAQMEPTSSLTGPGWTLNPAPSGDQTT